MYTVLTSSTAPREDIKQNSRKADRNTNGQPYVEIPRLRCKATVSSKEATSLMGHRGPRSNLGGFYTAHNPLVRPVKITLLVRLVTPTQKYVSPWSQSALDSSPCSPASAGRVRSRDLAHIRLFHSFSWGFIVGTQPCKSLRCEAWNCVKPRGGRERWAA